MASGNTLLGLDGGTSFFGPAWYYVAFTSGSVEPSLGDILFGDTSNAEATLEFLVLESGTWGGGDAAGYMLLSNWNGTAWTSAENWTKNTTTPANDGTFTLTAVACWAQPDTRNNIPIHDFDDTTPEVVMALCEMPKHYAGTTGITMKLRIMATSATTGNHQWKAFLKSLTADLDDIDTKVFAAPNTSSATATASAAGEYVDVSITFTDGADMDSIAAGEPFLLVLMRDTRNSDTVVGDTELLSVAIEET